MKKYTTHILVVAVIIGVVFLVYKKANLKLFASKSVEPEDETGFAANIPSTSSSPSVSANVKAGNLSEKSEYASSSSVSAA